MRMLRNFCRIIFFIILQFFNKNNEIFLAIFFNIFNSEIRYNEKYFNDIYNKLSAKLVGLK